jgi:hypothetical protein
MKDHIFFTKKLLFILAAVGVVLLTSYCNSGEPITQAKLQLSIANGIATNMKEGPIHASGGSSKSTLRIASKLSIGAIPKLSKQRGARSNAGRGEEIHSDVKSLVPDAVISAFSGQSLLSQLDRIDFVVTHVNPSAFDPLMPGASSARNSQRFRDWNEIYWAIRSIWFNGRLCPSTAPASVLSPLTPMSEAAVQSAGCRLRSVFLVVANPKHVPYWLRGLVDFDALHQPNTANSTASPPLSHAELFGDNCKAELPAHEVAFAHFLRETVKVVLHSDIFPAATGDNPLTEPANRKDPIESFNSNSIEWCLHRIPGLSRYFVYLNNDMLIGRPLHLAHLFKQYELSAAARPKVHVAESCITPISTYSTSTPVPPDWYELAQSAADISVQDSDVFQGLKKATGVYLLRLVDELLRYSSTPINSTGHARKRLAETVPTLLDFAHAPILYDRLALESLQQVPLLRNAIEATISTHRSQRNSSDLLLPFLYLNMRRLIPVVAKAQNRQDLSLSLQSHSNGNVVRSKQTVVRSLVLPLDEETVASWFHKLGEGGAQSPHEAFFDSTPHHSDSHFVMLSKEEQVAEESHFLMRNLEQMPHQYTIPDPFPQEKSSSTASVAVVPFRFLPSVELYYTLNDDFPENVLRPDIDHAGLLYDSACPVMIKCDPDFAIRRLMELESAGGGVSPILLGAMDPRGRGPGAGAGLIGPPPIDGARVLVQIHHLFCTWERIWAKLHGVY